jgi:hypothetical protein
MQKDECRMQNGKNTVRGVTDEQQPEMTDDRAGLAPLAFCIHHSAL